MRRKGCIADAELDLPGRGRCRIGRAFEPSGEPLATVNAAALRVQVQLARAMSSVVR
jgi:hypothetical protein